MRMDRYEKFTKKIEGKPIHVGERTLIPIIEFTTYSKSFELGHKNGGLVITGVTIEPVSVKVIEKEKEWIINIKCESQGP
jgi:uncharacterized spore protein YtfJ